VQRKVNFSEGTLTQDFSHFIEVHCGLGTYSFFGVAVLDVVNKFYLDFTFERNVFVY